MLETLLGNRTATLVLLFLERHGHAYSTQISVGLQIPVNMVQKQMERLEKGGILISARRGRRKVYTWDTSCPLYRPLRRLLKRGLSFYNEDPANGGYLSVQERIELAQDLGKQAQMLNPYRRYRPFAKSFENFKSYEAWRKKQKNPWLV